jgi:xylan 1,4-beta-xylosidase
MSKIRINPARKLPPLRHPWSHCITVGRGYELLRADLQAHLRFLQQEFGYRHIRFHASFHDDVSVVQKLPSGEIVYRWTQLDHIYDFLVDAGFDPIVEINPMPAALASGNDTFFWYKQNVTPPASYEQWENFIRSYIEHTVERYGIDRVRNWYFEIWNEPNLRNHFWTGTMEDYYELYASCAKVLKDFDSALQVGGPASAGSKETLPFAEWCRSREVPLDFVSYHSYPQGEACAYKSVEDSPFQPGMCFVSDIKETKRTLAKAGFGDLPIFMTEWNSQAQTANWEAKWVGNENVNNLFAGAAVCHLVHGCDADLDLMAWWVASDVFEEGGPQVEPYGSRFQYYGMLTIDGLPKSSFHAFKFMHQMRGQRYEVTLPEGNPPSRGAIVTDELSCNRVLIWNCVFPHAQGEPWQTSFDLPLTKNLSSRKTIRVTTATVREGQGSAYEFWKEMGAPPNLTRVEQDALSARSQPDYASRMLPVLDGRVSLSVKLGINEFVFIEVGGDEAANTDSLITSAEQMSLNESLMV